MSRRTDYTFSNLLTERLVKIEREYKHDVKMAMLCFPLAVMVGIIIIAIF